MRKTICTKLFSKGVDPQLIKVTNNLEAVINIRNQTCNKKGVSDMLSVLPAEM